jgi:hypothetical protein
MGYEFTLGDEYRHYLVRFEQLLGKARHGAPVIWKGRLVTRLVYEDFVQRFSEFEAAQKLYREILARGDTTNDAVLKLLRDRSAELLIEVSFAEVARY